MESPSRRLALNSTVQILRGVAVIAVLIYHARLPIGSGYLGVDVFFVISGYVIARSLLRSWAEKGTFRLRDFYLRRVKRLLPALLAVVILTVPLLTITASPLGATQNSLWTAMASLVGAGNILVQYLSGGYFGDDASVNHFLHTWSLGVEEQFYLLFPILLLGLLHLKRRANAFLVIGLSISLLGSLALAASANAVTLPFEALGLWDFYSPITRAWELLTGAVIAALGLGGLANARSSLRFVRGVSWVALTAALVFPTIDGTMLLMQVIAVISVAVLIGSSPRVNAIRRLPKFFEWLGFISYSLYLWHWPLIVISESLTDDTFAILLAGTLAIPIAGLSTHYLEEPLRRTSWRIPNVRSRLVFITLSAAFVVSGSWFVVGNGFWNKTILEGQSAILADHAPAKQNWSCALGSLTLEKVTDCTWNANASGAPIYLVGDSQAGQLAEALIETGKQLDRPVIISTAAGCGFFYSPDQAETCRDFVNRSLEILQNVESGDVVIAFAYGSQGIESLNSASTEQLYLEISLRHKRVSLALGVPMYRQAYDFNPLRCSLNRVSNGNCYGEMPKAIFEVQSSKQREFAAQLASALDNFSIIDLSSNFCSDELCATKTEFTEFAYKDTSHISVKASIGLANQFLNKLK